MSIFSKLFGKKQTEGEETSHVGGMEDFMTLIRVYYQSVMACNIGITNINFLPDMAVFKRTLKIPTQNNKLGIAEKSRCKKMLVELYGLSDDFFKEIDGSIKKNCKNVNDVKTYLFMFQGFSNDLMMLIGNLMQWKFRMPSIFKGALRSMTEKQYMRFAPRPCGKGRCAQERYDSPPIQRAVGILGTMDDRVCIQHSHAGKKRTKKKG